MDLHEKIIIKVQFNDEIKKMPIHNEEITFDELLLMMARVFKHKFTTTEAILIKYKDEDGDLITLADDSDLSFALASSNVLRLVLSITDESEPEEETDKPKVDSNVLMMLQELQNIRNGINKILDKYSGLHVDSSMMGNSEQHSGNHGAADYNGVSSKEFDPLSSNSQAINQNERAASVASSKQDEAAQRIHSNISSDKMENEHARQNHQQNMMPKQQMPDNDYPRVQQQQHSPSQQSNMLPHGKKMNEPKSPNKMMPPTHGQMSPNQSQGFGMPPTGSLQHNQLPGNMPPTNNQLNMGQGMPPTSSSHMMPPPMGQQQNITPTSQQGMMGMMPPSGQGMRPPISAPTAYNPSSMMNPPTSQMPQGGPPRMMPPTGSNAFRPPSSVPTTMTAPSNMMYNPRAGVPSPSPIMRPPASTGANNAGGGMIYPPNMPPAPSGPGGNYFNPHGVPQTNTYQQQYQK